MIIRNQYLTKISPFINKPVIKVISGIRRCGKSTFLRMLQEKLLNEGAKEKHFVFINKDSLRFDFISNYKELNKYVLKSLKGIKGKKYIFIDEIQAIYQWEKAIVGFLADNTGDIYITGSNSQLFSSELATLLSGRCVEFPMFTLTFSEFLNFRKIKNISEYEREFNLYLKYGGFPGVHQMENDDDVVMQYINSLYNTILLKDVVSRNSVRDVSLLERITRFVADNCGNITSSKKIADFIKSQKLKCSVDTVQNYLYWLSHAHIFYKVPRYDLKGKRLLEIHEKYYIGDIGLKHGILGYKMQDISGHLENIVFLELCSRGYTVYVGKSGEKEIDFIAVKKNKKIYIQVAYLLLDNNTIEREFRPLINTGDNYPKYVLSMDKHFDNDRDGIKWFNLIDFLVSFSLNS